MDKSQQVDMNSNKDKEMTESESKMNLPKLSPDPMNNNNEQTSKSNNLSISSPMSLSIAFNNSEKNKKKNNDDSNNVDNNETSINMPHFQICDLNFPPIIEPFKFSKTFFMDNNDNNNDNSYNNNNKAPNQMKPEFNWNNFEKEGSQSPYLPPSFEFKPKRKSKRVHHHTRRKIQKKKTKLDEFKSISIELQESFDIDHLKRTFPIPITDEMITINDNNDVIITQDTMLKKLQSSIEEQFKVHICQHHMVLLSKKKRKIENITNEVWNHPKFQEILRNGEKTIVVGIASDSIYCEKCQSRRLVTAKSQQQFYRRRMNRMNISTKMTKQDYKKQKESEDNDRVSQMINHLQSKPQSKSNDKNNKKKYKNNNIKHSGRSHHSNDRRRLKHHRSKSRKRSKHDKFSKYNESNRVNSNQNNDNNDNNIDNIIEIEDSSESDENKKFFNSKSNESNSILFKAPKNMDDISDEIIENMVENTLNDENIGSNNDNNNDNNNNINNNDIPIAVSNNRKLMTQFAREFSKYPKSKSHKNQNKYKSNKKYKKNSDFQDIRSPSYSRSRSRSRSRTDNSDSYESSCDSEWEVN